MPKKLKQKITENDVKKQIKDYLDIKQYFHFHIMQGMGAYRGIPDRIALKDGRILFIEAKSPKGRQSEHQKEFQRQVEKAGFEYILVRCIEDLIERGV